MTTDAVALAPGAILIYIYRPERSDDSIPLDELTPGNLLIAPLMTNRLPWSRGYFEFVAHRELREHDRLGAHCFRDVGGNYFDDFWRPIGRPTRLISEQELHSFRTIDDLVSDALGIPQAPD